MSPQVLRVVTERDAGACDPAIRTLSESEADTHTLNELLSPETKRASKSPGCTSSEEEGASGDGLALEEGMAAGSWSGGSIWDSSELLAQMLIDEPPEFWRRHRRVLELGAGCGLSGIGAAAMGAQLVALTDQVVYMAEHNVAANFAPADRGNIHVQVLRWGNAEDVSAALELGCSEGDGDDVAGRPYDLLLGSDCIYHREHHARLAATIDALSGPSTTVLWVSPGAYTSDPANNLISRAGSEIISETISCDYRRWPQQPRRG